MLSIFIKKIVIFINPGVLALVHSDHHTTIKIIKKTLHTR